MTEAPIDTLPGKVPGAAVHATSSWFARAEWKLMIAVVAAWGIGKAGLNTMPLLFSALADGLGLNAEQLGALGSIELLAIAAGSILMAPFIARVRRRRLAIGLALFTVLAYALSAAVDGYSTLAVIRFVAGLAGGVVVALGNAAGASAKDPDALFGWVLILASVAGFVLLGILPLAIGAGGYTGGYLMVGLVSLGTLPFLYLLPEAAPVNAQHLAPADAVSSPLSLSPTTLAALGILAANFMQGFTNMALWAFTAELGERVGFSLTQVGLLIGAGTAVLTAGALVPILIGTRWGRTLPILVTTVLVGISQWGLVHAPSAWGYTAMLLLWCLTTGTLFPYLMGAAAPLDRLGRWTAASGSMALFGGALGPVAAGVALHRFGYDALGWMFVASVAVNLACSIPATRFLDRRGDAL